MLNHDFLKPLNSLAWCRADFFERVDGVEVSEDRDATLASLKPHHDAQLKVMGVDGICYAEQVHGADVAVVDKCHVGSTITSVDGLISNSPGLALGIYVADCGAVYLADKKQPVIGLLHSGKKGSELGITRKAIQMMHERFESNPQDLICCLAPCIRPPVYEIDFSTQIRDQFLASGGLEENFHDSGVCTSSDLERFYSYRVEKGNTGRMLSVISLCD